MRIDDFKLLKTEHMSALRKIWVSCFYHKLRQDFGNNLPGLYKSSINVFLDDSLHRMKRVGWYGWLTIPSVQTDYSGILTEDFGELPENSEFIPTQDYQIALSIDMPISYLQDANELRNVNKFRENFELAKSIPNYLETSIKNMLTVYGDIVDENEVERLSETLSPTLRDNVARVLSEDSKIKCKSQT